MWWFAIAVRRSSLLIQQPLSWQLLPAAAAALPPPPSTLFVGSGSCRRLLLRVGCRAGSFKPTPRRHHPAPYTPLAFPQTAPSAMIWPWSRRNTSSQQQESGGAAASSPKKQQQEVTGSGKKSPPQSPTAAAAATSPPPAPATISTSAGGFSMKAREIVARGRGTSNLATSARCCSFHHHEN